MSQPRLVVWAAEPINYIRWVNTAGPSLSGTASRGVPYLQTNELQWTPIPWPSSWDVIAAAQECPTDLPITGAAGAPLYPPEGEDQVAGLYEEADQFTTLMGFLLEDLSKITVVVDDQWVYIIAPPDSQEVLALHEADLAEYDERLGGVEAAAGALSGPVLSGSADIATDRNVWTVWAVRTADLLSEIQYHLLEPTIDGGVTWQFWTRDEVLRYLGDRVARWFMETCLIRRRTSTTLLAGEQAFPLDSTLALLQRVYAGGMLERTSRLGLDEEDQGWGSDTGTPSQYVDVSFNWTETAGSVRVYPTPTQDTQISYVWVPTDGSVTGVDTLGLPATLSWGLKYGVMADMLNREGEGNDPERAAYCETRYKDSVALAKMLMGEEVKQGG